MKLLLSPHNDDAELFACYTLIREKPLVVVVTDSYVQHLRGDMGCSAEERWQETRKAMDLLGCCAVRLGLPDSDLDGETLRQGLQRFHGFTTVYIPAEQGGHPQHDFIYRIAKDVFGSACVEYTTYTKQDLYTTGQTEVIPTEEEKELKNKALDCYQSQIKINRPHFEAVVNKSEWLNFT